jgi:hypothetical protein
MVKSIAEQAKIKMPSFFGYMAYSCVILLPVFVLVTLVFLKRIPEEAPGAAQAPPAVVQENPPAPWLLSSVDPSLADGGR